MRATLRRARRQAGVIKRRLFAAPEITAWRRACREAETAPRFTPGRIRMLEYDVRYSDLLSFCPQWEDIFVKRTLDFRCAHDSPRILDCGANVGVATLFYKRRYPSARITAFEADPGVCAILDANMKNNGAADVEAVHGAVWTVDGTLSFSCEGSDSGMIGALPGAVAGTSVQVPSVRLKSVIEREPIDLLKLDIEGAEGAVLEDCAGALHNVRALLLDLHEFDPAVRQAPRVLELLTRAGFAYAVGELAPLPWRKPLAGATTPFPARAMTWAMLVRAWRE